MAVAIVLVVARRDPGAQAVRKVKAVAVVEAKATAVPREVTGAEFCSLIDSLRR